MTSDQCPGRLDHLHKHKKSKHIEKKEHKCVQLGIIERYKVHQEEANDDDASEVHKKSYKCNKCDRSFSEKSNLKKHIN